VGWGTHGVATVANSDPQSFVLLHPSTRAQLQVFLKSRTLIDNSLSGRVHTTPWLATTVRWTHSLRCSFVDSAELIRHIDAILGSVCYWHVFRAAGVVIHALRAFRQAVNALRHAIGNQHVHILCLVPLRAFRQTVNALRRAIGNRRLYVLCAVILNAFCQAVVVSVFFAAHAIVARCQAVDTLRRTISHIRCGHWHVR
jgi:hypothetical protein